jgi:hypothetical protein
MDAIAFTLPSIAEVVRDLGYRARVHADEGFAGLESASSGCTFWMYFLDAHEDYLSGLEAEASLVRFRGGWGGMSDFFESDLDELCNRFNRMQSFAKAFWYRNDDDVSFTVEADLYVLDGMSAKAFQNRVSAFVVNFEWARRCLDACPRIGKREIHERHARAVDILRGAGGDPAEAVAMYRQNAHAGFAGSQNNFGDLFEHGEHVPPDLPLAVYWYTRAAERGEPTAYFSLADVLSQSDDNIDSLVVAAQYAILAAERLPEGKNRLVATQLRDSLEARLGEEAWAHAGKLEAGFRPLYAEQWVMDDTPGPEVIEAPGSDALN